MRTLDIYLRTHSGPDVHSGGRVLNLPKEEIIFGCLRSLMASLSLVDAEKYRLRLTVLDDHSNELCISGIKQILAGNHLPWSFISLFSRGVGPSFGATYLHARETAEDLIYFVEDDYLHSRHALPEMLEAYEQFSVNMADREVGIFPVDYPDRYHHASIRPAYLVFGPRRHWRTVDSATGTFLLSRKLFLDNFAHCMRMSLYAIDPSISEDSSLNYIWRSEGAFLFSPLSSLALHLQGRDQIPPGIDPLDWWQKYAQTHE